MTHHTFDCPTYVGVMEHLLAVPLNDERRRELTLQLERIAVMAASLMAFPLPERQEGAGVYTL